jgi:hypothetical protein
MDLKLKIKAGLLKHNNTYLVHDGCVKEIQNQPSHELLKNNIQLLISVCNVVEGNVDSKKFKIDKKALVISIMDTVYKLTESEKEIIDGNIDALHLKGDIHKEKLHQFMARMGIAILKKVISKK